MYFYYRFIAENAVLLEEINFCLKNCDFIVKINETENLIFIVESKFYYFMNFLFIANPLIKIH
jgi:hypothetical protein